MNLVLIETSGNQRYIFATNKLRENVGASELTCRVGTELVLKAVDKEKGVENDGERKLWDANDLNGSKLRKNLLDKSKNPEIGNGNKVEVIVATSGKAILLVDEKKTAEKIIFKVTQTALKEMPGLTVHGKISDDVEANLSNIHEAIGEVHSKLEDVRYEMPSNEQRFLRLPFAAPCNTSGLPASVVITEGEGANKVDVLLSNDSFTKQQISHQGRSRLEAVIYTVNKKIRLAKDVDKLENLFKDLSWVAVIHADGNGLGKIFLNFDKHTGLKDGQCRGREYLDKYRMFSIALDICTINAAGHALDKLQQRFLAEEEERERKHGKTEKQSDMIPVVPLVLGGDDLTVLCDGQYALKFTYEFLQKFEEETGKNHELVGGIVADIAEAAFGIRKLGICAGVAIVKPHFPFHQAYELAESLLKSAKQVKEKIKRRHNDDDLAHPCSALDYHILYDSTASELSAIRDQLKVDNEATWLYARPYVVSKFEEGYPSHDWLAPRRWDELEKRVAAMMLRDDDNKRMLPNSQLHALRESLFLGKDEAIARANLVQHRYESFKVLLWSDNMFFPEKHDNKDGYATHFLDALDIVEFRKGEMTKDGKRLEDK